MEVKYKRVMSLSTQTLINLSRDAMDDEITHEEFLHIMFILGCYEEAGWEYENLKKKAKNLIDGLSAYAKEQLNKAVAEGSQMYLRCWDLIDKQNKKRNGNKNKGNDDAGKPAKVDPVPEKKEKSDDDQVDFWIDGDYVAVTPDAAEKIKKAGFKVEDVAGYIQANEKILVLAFDPYPIEEIIEMYKEQMKRQYPAAPSRGK